MLDTKQDKILAGVCVVGGLVLVGAALSSIKPNTETVKIKPEPKQEVQEVKTTPVEQTQSVAPQVIQAPVQQDSGFSFGDAAIGYVVGNAIMGGNERVVERVVERPSRPVYKPRVVKTVKRKPKFKRRSSFGRSRSMFRSRSFGRRR